MPNQKNVKFNLNAEVFNITATPARGILTKKPKTKQKQKNQCITKNVSTDMI